MTLIMARDKYQMSYAICKNSGGTDLTAWDNSQAALIVGELNALDWFISANITHTKPKTKNINPMTAGIYPKRIQTGRVLGALATSHHLQTGILTYATMGTCTTTNPSAYLHTIDPQTTTNPVFLGFHYEKEGTNTQRRKDLLGFVPVALDIHVDETEGWIATQTYTGQFAYSGAGGDLALPTQFTQATHAPYTWGHYKDTNGASALTYNSGALNLDIVSIDMHIGWSGAKFGPYDSSGYPTDGHLIPPFDSYVTLGVRVTDAANTAWETISDLAHGSYAGDIQFICDFYESASRYLKYTWTDMYIDVEATEEVFQAEGSWFDGVNITLRFRDETSTLQVLDMNALTDDYYENPA